MAGKRLSGYKSHKRDDRVKQIPSKLKFQEQMYWRRDCLKERMLLGTLTDKNLKDAENVGLRLTITKLENGKIAAVPVV